MSIGISGSHRSGKSTLAEAFAKRYGIPFVKTSSSEVFRVIDRDPAKDYPIEERLGIQEALLYAFERQFALAQKNSKVWISDRTPVDLASYLLADVRRTTVSHNPEMGAMINGYVEKCITRTNQWFSTVMLLQPGIALVEAEGKAPCCPAYIEHLNLLQSGLLLDEGFSPAVFRIPRRFTNLEDRLNCIHSAVEKTVDGAAALAQARKIMGVSIH